jgi:hypothetical protein
VQGFLDEGERIIHKVHMWSRHRLVIPYMLGAGSAGVALSVVLGVDDWGSRTAIGLVVAMVAAAFSTEYRILVATTSGLVMLRSSKFRQKATALVGRLGEDTVIKPVSANLVISDWQVGKHGRFSVMKRFQAEMVAISQL